MDPTSHDINSVNRSQSAQRHAKYRSKYRGRQESVASTRGPGWAVRGNRRRDGRGYLRLPRFRSGRHRGLRCPYRRRARLVLRLASLLWRLRRATANETDLLRMQAEILRESSLSGLQANSQESSAQIGKDLL